MHIHIHTYIHTHPPFFVAPDPFWFFGFLSPACGPLLGAWWPACCFLPPAVAGGGAAGQSSRETMREARVVGCDTHCAAGWCAPCPSRCCARGQLSTVAGQAAAAGFAQCGLLLTQTGVAAQARATARQEGSERPSDHPAASAKSSQGEPVNRPGTLRCNPKPTLPMCGRYGTYRLAALLPGQLQASPAAPP